MIRAKKIKPLFNRIVTTAERYEEVLRGRVIDAARSNAIKEYQRVVAVGTTVRDVHVGDVVLVDPSRYAVRRHREGSLKDGVITDNPVTGYDFNVVEVGGERCLLLFDTDVVYVMEEYEEIDDGDAGLLLPDTSLIGV